MKLLCSSHLLPAALQVPRVGTDQIMVPTTVPVSSALCRKDTGSPARLGNSETLSTRAEDVKNLAYTYFVRAEGAYVLGPADPRAQLQRCISKMQGPSDRVGDWVQRVFELIIVKFSFREKSLGITSLEMPLISGNLLRVGSPKPPDAALSWGPCM